VGRVWPRHGHRGRPLNAIVSPMVRRAVLAILPLHALPVLAESEAMWVSIPTKAKHFSCSPAVLSKGDKVSIRVSSPHGTDLGVRTPSNTFYFVYSCDTSLRSPQWKEIECETFSRRQRITIDPASFRASGTAQMADSKLDVVFKAPGVYTILLAKNLETENTDETLNMCQVRVTSGSRGKP
jgi:hypothetical protein